MRKSVLIIVVPLIVLASMSVGAESTPKMSKKEVKALIANAKTAADHQRLAAYYRDEATRLKERQQEHEEEAIEYSKNPWCYTVPKYPTLGQHCRQLAGYYGMGAQKALKMAELHESLAKDAKQTEDQK
jgi:hypothetical protein